MRARDDVTMAVEIHADAELRACAVYLREKADREDAFQETFLRYARSNKTFRSEEHRKAWLIRVAINICKDMLKRASSRVDSLDAAVEHGVAVMGDDGMEGQRELESEGLLVALGQLEERYRTVLYLKYYEGYTAAQIAAITGMPENTVYTNLSRGKRQLLGVIQNG
jgi:RNA polymerase sigma-70 factor (ECF subfamily)